MSLFPVRFIRIASVLAVSLALAACGDSPEKLLASARQHLEKNDPASASIELKNALAKDPNLAEARFLLGKALLLSGDSVNAEVELKKAAELNYSQGKVAGLMMQSLLSRGEYKRVVDGYVTLEPADPAERAQVKTNLGYAYAALSKLDQATSAFDAALAAQPDYAPALLAKARIKAAAQDIPGAQAIVDGVLSKDPKQVDALMFRAALQAAAGQRDAALATYRAVLDVRADNAGAHTALIMANLQDQKVDEAQKQLDAMKKALPKNPQTDYMQATLAMQQKNLPLAKETAQNLLRIAPNDPRVLLLAGAIEFESRSDLQAQEYLSQALARAPASEFGRRMLVRSYLRSGQTGKAVTALQPALEAKEPTSAMLSLAGEVYMQAGDSSKAETYFSRASKANPNDPRNRTALAMLHVNRGDARGVDELEEIASSDKGTSADMALIATSLHQKRFDQALKAIATLEKKQPDNLAVYNLRAAALHGKGDIPGARQSLEKALSINPAYFPAAAALARLDLIDKKPDQAAARFESVLAKDPKSLQALMALAELRGREGKMPQALDLIKRAIAASPTDVSARIALINFHLSQKDNKSAVTAAQEALQAIPDRPELLAAAGRAMFVAGELTQATTTYSKLVALLPNSPQPYLGLAEAQVAAKNREAARETLARGLNVQPDSVLLRRGMVVLDSEEKRYPEALNGARLIQKQEPKLVLGYVLEGDVYASQQSWGEAQAAYRKGLSKVSDSNELAVRLHAAMTAGGQSAEAGKFAETWLKSHPKDDGFRLYVAGIAVKNKDYATAVSHYRRILDGQPNNAAVLNDLAWTLGQMGDPKALAYAEQANKLVPNQPAMMDTLGVLQVEQGQVAKGTELLRKAVALAPQVGDIRLNLARALIKGGDKAGARAELETLAKLGEKFARQSEVNDLLKTL